MPTDDQIRTRLERNTTGPVEPGQLLRISDCTLQALIKREFGALAHPRIASGLRIGSTSPRKTPPDLPHLRLLHEHSPDTPRVRAEDEFGTGRGYNPGAAKNLGMELVVGPLSTSQKQTKVFVSSRTLRKVADRALKQITEGNDVLVSNLG
jgi:hypothetical protein